MSIYVWEREQISETADYAIQNITEDTSRKVESRLLKTQSVCFMPTGTR
jgi:hypothetical protein